LRRHAQEWLDYSEHRMVEALGRIPAGEVTGRSVHDPFPWVPDGVPIEARIRVRHDPERITVDLRDNPDCLPCGLNLTEATARTSALLGVFNALEPGIPPNGGSFRRVDVLLRENCCVGVPVHPASCSVSTTNLAERVANAVQCGMADLGDGVGMAEAGFVMQPCDAVISGRDPRTDEPFINQIFFASSGGGGGPHADGVLCLGHVGAAGATRLNGVETTELRYPVRIVEQRVLQDSEGAGRFRGAPANRVEYGPIGTTIRVMYASGGYEEPARGACGGAPGARAGAYRRQPDGTVEMLPSDGDIVLEPGQTVISISCSGGGYGPATERDPERVRADVAEGWVSRERARITYGVVLRDDGSIDEVKTETARTSLAAPPDEP
jgi:N-methylhydantoinase B